MKGVMYWKAKAWENKWDNGNNYVGETENTY